MIVRLKEPPRRTDADCIVRFNSMIVRLKEYLYLVHRGGQPRVSIL